MVLGNKFDPLYTAKKDIEDIIAENDKDERINKIVKKKGLKLSEIVENEIKISYDTLTTYTSYRTRDYKRTLIELIENIEYIKEFSKSTYPSIKFKIDFDRNDEKYYIEGMNDKGETLFSFNISKNKYETGDLTKTYIYTNIYKKFAENADFAKEFFSIINKNVILKDINDSYRDILTADEANEQEGPEDRMNSLGIEVYKGEIGMKSVGGYRDIKDRIEREIFTPFTNKKLLSEIRELTRGEKRNEVNGALFYGEPGTGKTLMARAISYENEINFLYLNIAQIYSKWYGESANRMKTAMDTVKRYAKENGKTVLFIDEIDSLGDRKYLSTESSKVLNVLLTYLSGIKSDNDDELLFIGCTNMIENLDPALLSRFKSKIYFRKPNKDDRKEVLSTYCRKLDENELEELADKSDNLTGRDLESIASIAEDNLAYDIAKNRKNYKIPRLEDYLAALSIFKQHSEEQKTKNSSMYS